MPDSKLRPILSFLICQTLCFAVGFIGSQASMIGLQAWYPALNKPAFNPPGWVFAPVWSILYFMMGVALWQVWSSRPGNNGASPFSDDRAAKGEGRVGVSRARSWGLALFVFQLILNGLWSWIFFAWQRLPMAFGEIVLLDLAILATILAFNKVRSSAAWLLVPYLAWCCFATLLTFSIWKLNPVGGTPKDGEVRIELGPS